MTLAELYLKDYIAQDGGGKLKPTDERLPFATYCPWSTTLNENPILFLVQSAIELTRLEPDKYLDFKYKYSLHMDQTWMLPGLHSRRCGDYTIRRQSHDNVVAMCIGSWYFKTVHAQNIYDYGNSVFWNYNVISPPKFDIKSQIQGGDIAIATYAVNKVPNVLFLLWLAVGLAISKTYNLADLRIWFIEQKLKSLPIHHRLVLKAAIWIHKKRRGPRLKWIEQYFKGSEHPFLLAARINEGFN